MDLKQKENLSEKEVVKKNTLDSRSSKDDESTSDDRIPKKKQHLQQGDSIIEASNSHEELLIDLNSPTVTVKDLSNDNILVNTKGCLVTPPGEDITLCYDHKTHRVKVVSPWYRFNYANEPQGEQRQFRE